MQRANNLTCGLRHGAYLDVVKSLCHLFTVHIFWHRSLDQGCSFINSNRLTLGFSVWLFVVPCQRPIVPMVRRSMAGGCRG